MSLTNNTKLYSFLCLTFLFILIFLISRRFRRICVRSVNATACPAAAPSRPAGCVCQRFAPLANSSRIASTGHRESRCETTASGATLTEAIGAIAGTEGSAPRAGPNPTSSRTTRITSRRAPMIWSTSTTLPTSVSGTRRREHWARSDENATIRHWG